jgi:hypothetical protein
MAAGSDYDRSLARLAGEGVTDAQDLVYALAREDLTEAAALFRPEWEHTEGVPGVDKLDSHLTMKLIKSPQHQIAPPTAGHGA